MPLYNMEASVARAIDSVLSQTVPDYELLIVNDGSSDRSPEIVEAYRADTRVRVIHQENSGVSVARNNGIAQARGEIIALLDADDQWGPDFLETIVRLLGRFPQCDVFATNYCFVAPSGRISLPSIRGLPRGFHEGILDRYFEMASRGEAPLLPSASAFTRKSLLSIEGFPRGIKSGEDLVVYARLAVNYRIAYTVEAKCMYWLAISQADKPVRLPEAVDQVGGILVGLAKSNPQVPGLRRYISAWYKTRASTFLRLGRAWPALADAARAIGKYPFNFVLYCYCAAACVVPIWPGAGRGMYRILGMLRRLRTGARVDGLEGGAMIRSPGKAVAAEAPNKP